jgi:molybdopterin converting factor subunit 1
MKIKVSFFAQSREIAGQSQMDFEIKEGDTVSDLLSRLISRFHDLSSVHIMVAVNSSYVDNSQILHDGDEVAIIPPVSGG